MKSAQSVARAARKAKLAEERKERLALRAADKKRMRDLTKAGGTARAKIQKFKAVRKELLSELRSLLKACEAQSEKLTARFAAVEALCDKFADMSESYTSNVAATDFDIENSLAVLNSAIEEVTDTKN